ncbi:cytochrome c oxidase subunit II [Nitratireductor sp. ZSWI3]|uniref:cytochrome c oxidase subunit II n=1 Tax=Nitratireductor sp. ZSWI3 TaxID=2966359 RepID=UPI0021502A59|nr:cytochrome c oxidase subunit II [Nitratireductor sp. ZSWI3]MCR4264676.1 c-type cytochrome [Nitratireductor sp. ZSWI3]
MNGDLQSALRPAGREAGAVYDLLLAVTGLSAAIMLLVLILIAAAMWGPAAWRERLGREWLVYGGGIVLPIILLSGLLGYGLVVMEAGASRASRVEGPPIAIIGKRWWWKVDYTTPSGTHVASANELRLPVGRPVALQLTTDDVIHSFWAPKLAGKLDMIPGRTNTLTVEATEPGISRGQCAEYCGGAHALMSFFVVAMPAEEYDAWLRSEAEPAKSPSSATARRGETLFLENGCGGCHTVRGTEAAGTIGPDLTHVGGRHSLAAGTMANDAEAFARWIRENQHIKPDNLMPAYRNLEPDELAAIATYLEGLD